MANISYFCFRTLKNLFLCTFASIFPFFTFHPQYLHAYFDSVPPHAHVSVELVVLEAQTWSPNAENIFLAELTPTTKGSVDLKLPRVIPSPRTSLPHIYGVTLPLPFTAHILHPEPWHSGKPHPQPR